MTSSRRLVMNPQSTAGLVLVGVVTRLLPHPANMVPITAMAVWGGARVKQTPAAILIPLAAMVLSDLFLGWHSTIGYVYGSLIATVLLARWLTTRPTIARIGLATFFGSLLFYLVTNYGVWAVPMSMYPHTFAGLMASYINGLPFWRNSLIGDIGYTVILFGIDYTARHWPIRQPKFATKPQS